MMWIAIDAVLLIILIIRKNVANYDNVMHKRSIESVKSMGMRVMDALLKILLLIPVELIIYVLMCFISNTIIQKLLEWYKGIFIVALFPLLFTWVKGKKINIKLIWNSCLTVLAITFSIIGYMIDTQDIKAISKYRGALNLLMTLLVIMFIIAVFEIRKESKEYYSRKISKKGIRKDLHFRTSVLALNVSNIELVKCCEKYFDEYICRYRRIKELHTIEYVNLVGVHKELWYKKSAHFMKIFVVLSVLITIMKMFLGVSYKCLVILGLIVFFEILIVLYKCVDLECLYKMAIRYFYDEWGYYLTYANRSKFVGTVQIIEVSKFHQYIHSFLDIVALCRAVAFNDKMNGENKICIITSNLSELFLNYSDYKNSKNWVMVIPLWIAVLFEYYVTGEISNVAKDVLMKSVNKNTRADISIFLQSFWADIERKELKEGIAKYIQLFEEKMYG